MGTLRITYRHSTIGHPKGQKLTVRSLGLRKLHQTVELTDRPEVRGMLKGIMHHVTVEEVADGAKETE